MRLFIKSTGLPVTVGDTVRNFRGEYATVRGWTAPKHAGSAGKVLVREDSAVFGAAREFYPSVWGLEWREDQPTVRCPSCGGSMDRTQVGGESFWHCPPCNIDTTVEDAPGATNSAPVEPSPSRPTSTS